MKKHWEVAKDNPKLKGKLTKSLSISPVTAQLLINRGIETEQEAEQFLNSTLFDLPSPFLLKGMERAVERVERAILQKEKIAIYGDYDVDGVTATALLYTFLNGIGAVVMYYNPDRMKEGYGVNAGAIRKLKQEGVSLIISGDCGISAIKEVEEAKRLGIDFIVTDHHRVPPMLPEAVAVLNPHQPGCTYPGKEIAGVGVIFNLAIALRRSLRDSGFFKNGEPNLGDYLDLVALGTVADCASLRNVNRIFVKEGIKRMASPKRIGIAALKETSGIKGEVNSFDLGFKLGPRVNAGGRLKTAALAVELMISRDQERAKELAKMLSAENSNRQEIEEEMIKDALNEIESNPDSSSASAFVLASRNWHPGVIGIVASRLVEMFSRPAVLIAISENGLGKGSGRSVEGIDIYKALCRCEDLFEQFGGHEAAGGMTIKHEKIDEFRDRFQKAVLESDGKFIFKLKIDAAVDLSEMTESLVSEFNMIGPFGIDNSEPVLLAKSAQVINQKVIKDKHLSLRLKSGDKVFDAMWFNLRQPQRVPEFVDIVFTPEFNIWNGKKEVRLRVRDLDW